MNKKTAVWVALFFFALGLAAALAVRNMPHHHAHGPAAAPQEKINLWHQPLRDVQGDATTLAAAAGGDGVFLVNFWATGCAPCLREMPLLQQAAAVHGVKTAGISYEALDIINAFAADHPVSYSLYKASFDIFYFFQQQGNRTAVLPYTVLIDGGGRVMNEKIGDFRSVAEVVDFVQQSQAVGMRMMR